MSLSGVGDGESFPGSNLSISQLLDAAKRKLQGPIAGGRAATTKNSFEVVARFERDATEVLRLVRSIENDFAPINRIPPELFSLVARHLGKLHTDKTLITLTHLCQGLREVFTSDSSLWTYLDCANVEKTRVYLERSKSSPLKIFLNDYGVLHYREDAFRLTLPHTARVCSIKIRGGEGLFKLLITHFSCPVPLLKNLDLRLSISPLPVLNRTLFNGDLSALSKLKLSGVDPHLPWRNLSNLTFFSLLGVPGAKISVTRLLDLFVIATFLSEIKIGSLPDSSDVSPGRVVPLSYLKRLTIFTKLGPSSILLNHLFIPPGALLRLGFHIPDDEFRLRKLLPTTSNNLQNISHVTSIQLHYNEEDVLIQLNGPSGQLHVRGYRDSWSSSRISDHILLRSLDNFALSRIQELRVTTYEFSNRGRDESSPRHILGAMKHLRTLSLDRGNHIPFIFALNPNRHPLNLLLCPRLESLILYDEDEGWFGSSELVKMTRERMSRGLKLQSMTLVSIGRPLPMEELVRFEEYVTRVEHRFEDSSPEWDTISCHETE